MESVARFFKSPGQCFFLFGPRGTGKSWWTKDLFPQALYVDLLRPEVYRTYSARPETLRELIEGNPSAKQVVIDEVQKVPSVLSVVHSLIEEKRDLQFILTGSSARKIKRSGVDLLAGRALFRSLHPFMAAELKDYFHVEEALEYGLVPLIVASKNPADVLQSYASLYVREEVKMEGMVRNIGDFSRFLEAISFSHASLLNASHVARECEIGRKTVEGYISILEDLLLSTRLPVFSTRAKRATVVHPKFYFFDTGIFRSLRPHGPLDRPGEIEGAALEGLVMQHLKAWNSYRGERNRMYYWRTRSGSEVDFVLYGEDGLFAIEVKNSSRIHPKDIRALCSFREDYPSCQPILLYRGTNRLKKHDILCMPCDEFLRHLHPENPFPE